MLTIWLSSHITHPEAPREHHLDPMRIRPHRMPDLIYTPRDEWQTLDFCLRRYRLPASCRSVVHEISGNDARLRALNLLYRRQRARERIIELARMQHRHGGWPPEQPPLPREGPLGSVMPLSDETQACRRFSRLSDTEIARAARLPPEAFASWCTRSAARIVDPDIPRRGSVLSAFCCGSPRVHE